MATKKQVATKIRKKKWLTLIAPKLFNEQPLGETPTYENDEVLGKHLIFNLMNLARDAKKQGINLRFRVKEIKGEKAYTELIGYEILPSSIRRLVRREKDKVDDSFIVSTKDNFRVVIKPLLITRNKTKGSILTRLRKEAKIAYLQLAKKVVLADLLSNAVTGGLQKTIKDRLNKIYPLKVSEIKILRVREQSAAPEQAPVAQEVSQPPQVTQPTEQKEANV